jgi:hypothetical protein
MPLRTDGVPIPPAPGSDAHDTVLPVPYFSQNPYLNLCWAACAQMVMAYNHITNVNLCDIASKIFHTDCCADLRSCDAAAWPWQVYDSYGISYKTAGGAMSPNSLQAWIGALRLVQAYFQWSDDHGNHTALIVGYYANGDLLVYDPKWGIGRQNYNFVLHGYGMGSWQETWYDMESSGGPLA